MRHQRLSWLEGRLPKDLRALTIRHPWAWCVVHGFKAIENRSQPLPGKFLGEVVAIHASHAQVDEDNLTEAEKLVRTQIPEEGLERGSIIGFARFVGSVRSRKQLRPSDAKWFHGPYGWLVEDVVLLPKPIPCNGALGFWRVPRRVVAQLRAQVDAAARPAPPRVFSWGYAGWGTAVRQALARFDAVEKAYGFRPPLFVDIRAKQNVRAEGFSGPTNAFARAAGAARYRHLRGLGNGQIATGRGPMRLTEPAAVGELLGLVLRAQLDRRRVVFFCGCESPYEFHSCHRRLVTRALARLAKRHGLPLAVEEWPGGTPRGAPELVRVDDAELEALVGGKNWIDLRRKQPNAKLLGLPVGSVVRVKAGRREGVCVR